MIPKISAKALLDRKHSGHTAALNELGVASRDIGFAIITQTPVSAGDVSKVIELYRQFFRQTVQRKSTVDMAKTGSNRGWGAPKSERVDPHANPDFKEVFDCGFELPANDPLRERQLSVYADNQWPDVPKHFKDGVLQYYGQACSLAHGILEGLAQAIGEDETYFANKFDRPMALLRGNYYPPRPAWAGAHDFGIAEHTDYGCLTLLASDGTPGLEVRNRSGEWLSVNADLGDFVINFGEMFEIWTGGAVRATPHRVVGGMSERISVPMFFNPNYDTNVAPAGSGKVILAGDHLSKRYNETYVHLIAG